jgi:SAM-dependent methyltransferase
MTEPHQLPVTGERTIPGIPAENYWFRRHEVAYGAAAPLCRGNRVLEAGCGEGYGAAAIRDAEAASVVALDYDATATPHVRAMYGLPTVQANLVALPFADRAFDVVLSLQTIEHLWDQPAFVAECARTLRPGGRLVLTTPNRLTFPPGNLFHTRELDPAELTELVEAGDLCIESLLGIHHGERIADYPGDLVADQLANDPDNWPADLSATVADLAADDFALSPDDLDACLDLYLVAVRS